MSLQDMINQIDEENRIIEQNARKYTDEEIYQNLLSSLYQQLITKPIAKQYAEDSTLTTITGEFNLVASYKAVSFVIPSKEARFLNKDSDLYSFDVFEGEAHIGFKDVAMLDRGSFPRIRINFTPLGDRVYKDLRSAAAKDNVALSAPKPYFLQRKYLEPKKIKIYLPLGKSSKVKRHHDLEGYGIDFEYSYQIRH